MIEIKRALISCWNKEGIEELAQALREFRVEIISSGGTAAHLRQHDIPVTTVESLTGYPSILGGRVKTLHPKIHAAILAADSPEHQRDLEKIDVKPVQLVVVNLYPFVTEAMQKNLSLDDAIEFIDIGGPAMLRAAAKNFRHVVALHLPGQYPAFIEQLRANGGSISPEYSRSRAKEAFLYTCWYDSQVHSYFSGLDETAKTSLPAVHTLLLEKQADLRYGENPHQKAAVYHHYGGQPVGMEKMQQLWGKPLSYNNYVDVQAAYALVLEFEQPAVAIVKHTNPCGAAVDNALSSAFEKALRGDSVSAFGGIVACNRTVDDQTAELISKIFFECIIAPQFETAALEILQKKKNLRLLSLAQEDFSLTGSEIKSLNGVFLLQERDAIAENRTHWQVVTEREPNEQEWEELSFAWKIVKHVKSNAIVFTKHLEVYGVGAGQMSRVDSVKIARMKAEQAQRELTGCVMASDAFFPFRDGIDEAARSGITAVIQPGGSIRDEEVIQAANEHGLTMVFTGIRHFKH